MASTQMVDASFAVVRARATGSKIQRHHHLPGRGQAAGGRENAPSAEHLCVITLVACRPPTSGNDPLAESG